MDLINRNPGSEGFASLIGGGRLTDVRIMSDNMSPLGWAVSTGAVCGPGQLAIEGLEMQWGGTGIKADCSQIPVIISGLRARFTNRVLTVKSGSNVTVRNALIAGGTEIPIQMEDPAALLTTLSFDHLTLVSEATAAIPGIRALVGGKIGTAQISLRNSVVTGFDTTWQLGASPAPAANHIDFEAAYSYFDKAGTEAGDVTTTTTDHNIFGDLTRLTAGFSDEEYHLAADSPLVDAGDPGQALPDTDLEGNHRPLDGNEDGIAIRDIGAYEYVPPLPLPGPPTKALKITKLKFRYRVGHGGVLTFRISRKARVVARFSPRPRKTRPGEKRKTVKIVRRVKAGKVKIRLAKHRLTRGRYRLKLTATASGASSGIGRIVRAK